MNKPLYKFYDLENLTQEDLNKLALERNTYKSIIDKIKEEIEILNNVEYNANNFTILSLITRINELLEEVE